MRKPEIRIEELPENEKRFIRALIKVWIEENRLYILGVVYGLSPEKLEQKIEKFIDHGLASIVKSGSKLNVVFEDNLDIINEDPL